MTTLQEAAMRKALELGKRYAKCLMMNQAPFDEAIESLRTALAQQGEQQPVAYAAFADNGNIRIWTSAPNDVQRLSEQVGFELMPLYTAAPHSPQSAQPVSANIQTKIVKDISAHEGGKQQLPPLPTTELDALGCAYCNHPLFLGSKCKNCGKEVK